MPCFKSVAASSKPLALFSFLAPQQPKKARRKSMSATPDAEGGEMDVDEDGEEAVRGGNKKRKPGKAFKSA